MFEQSFLCSAPVADWRCVPSPQIPLQERASDNMQEQCGPSAVTFPGTPTNEVSYVYG